METLRNPEVIERGDEEVWRALIDGVGVINNFIPAETAIEFGKRLDLLVPHEDTVGIPLASHEEEWDEDPYKLNPKDKLLLAEIQNLLAAIYARAADVSDTDTKIGMAEMLKYVDNGMVWHVDAYQIVELPGYLKEMSIIVGVLTLAGEAEYLYKDPDTNKDEKIITKPGTLVLTRASDIDDLKTVEHAVTKPIQGAEGQKQNRIALVLSLCQPN